MTVKSVLSSRMTCKGSTAAEILVKPTTSEKKMETLEKNSGGTGLPCLTCTHTFLGSILEMRAESNARLSRLRPMSMEREARPAGLVVFAAVAVAATAGDAGGSAAFR